MFLCDVPGKKPFRLRTLPCEPGVLRLGHNAPKGRARWTLLRMTDVESGHAIVLPTAGAIMRNWSIKVLNWSG